MSSIEGQERLFNQWRLLESKFLALPGAWQDKPLGNFDPWRLLSYGLNRLPSAIQNPLDEFPFDETSVESWLQDCQKFEKEYKALKKAAYEILKKDSLSGSGHVDGWLAGCRSFEAEYTRLKNATYQTLKAAMQPAGFAMGSLPPSGDRPTHRESAVLPADEQAWRDWRTLGDKTVGLGSAYLLGIVHKEGAAGWLEQCEALEQEFQSLKAKALERLGLDPDGDECDTADDGHRPR